MRIFNFSVIVLLFPYTALGLAIPLTPSIIPRAQYCQNAPQTVAGTLLPPSPPSTHPPNLHPRKSTSTVCWCVPSSQTYLILTKTATASTAASIHAILSAAHDFIQLRLNTYGDGPVVNGGVDWNSVSGAVLRTWNTNNHQQTYGVLWAALWGLMGYMDANEWGGMSFTIFDGENEVGSGVVG